MNEKQRLATEARIVLNFLHQSEKLKDILRHGWTSSGRQESVAEHSWRLALMIIMASRHIQDEISIERALKIALIHDLPELIIGDVPYFLTKPGSIQREQKEQAESRAIGELTQSLPQSEKDDLEDLLYEYQLGTSTESKIVKAFDKIEAQIQQNEADVSTWVECEFEDATGGYIRPYCLCHPFAMHLADVVIEESCRIVEQHRRSVVSGAGTSREANVFLL